MAGLAPLDRTLQVIGKWTTNSLRSGLPGTTRSAQQAHDHPDQPGRAGEEAQVVDGPDADEDRDRGQDDAHLEAGDAQGELMVLVELVPAFGFQVLGFLLDVFLLVIVAVALLLELA